MTPLFPSRRPAGAPVPLGTLVTLPDPRVAEIAVLAGCDWLFVDCEHGAVAPADLSALLAAAHGVPALVRIASNEEQHVKHALDAGAAGVVCPRVDDARVARRLVSWAKYPPRGTRSVGIARAHGYGLHLARHLAEADATTSVVVQIESAAGVRAVESIVAVEGVGGVFVGPYDLSGSLGVPGQVDAPVVRDAVGRVVEACGRAGVPVGQFFADRTACDAAAGRPGLDFAAVGTDTSLLAAAVAAQMRPAGR
jgi:2-dehydro-3-deoxyglucarate aldolase